MKHVMQSNLQNRNKTFLEKVVEFKDSIPHFKGRVYHTFRFAFDGNALALFISVLDAFERLVPD